ncbi:MAG: response regulator transcription factor [Bdellovibrionales bacterium]|nr:response regulator transcription factor [Bdellovibrionales bacterium]
MRSSELRIHDVLLCEDHPFVLMGLEVVLKNLIPGLQRLRKSTTGEEAIGMARKQKPDLALVDLGLPDMGGGELIQQLKQLWPDLKIIVVTNCDNVSTLSQVKRLGVCGIMQKISSSDHLQQILEEAFSKNPKTPAMDPFTSSLLKNHEDIEFTPREYEVLQEIIQGLSNQQISEKLGCALTTVRFHRANILEKTGIRNAAELTAWFLQGQRKRH